MDLQPGSSRADRRKKISRVVVGSVTVRIYHGINQVAGRDYPQHTVVYHETDGRRVRRRFNDLADAKQEAEQIAMRLSRGQASILSLSDDDRAFYAQATELLKPFNKPLNLAVEEYVGALRLLPPGVRLHDAVAEFANRFRQVRETKPIPSVVTEFIASKEKAGLSDRHLADLKSRLVPFAEAFGIPPNELTGPALQKYLDGMRKSSRTRLNHWRHIVTMLRWSVRRKLAPRELLEELEAVERPRVESGAIGIWKPAEFAEILEATRHFRPDLLAWITLGGFSGLRTAELQRLDWSMVHTERGFVEVPASRAKTRQRRLAPLCDAAKEWLAHVPNRNGRVSVYSEENKVIKGLVDSVNRHRRDQAQATLPSGSSPTPPSPLRWIKNGLRHSFCSYRLAVVHDVARVALEAGNSSQMIFQHYRELVTEDDGKAWFATHPKIPLVVASANSTPISEHSKS